MRDRIYKNDKSKKSNINQVPLDNVSKNKMSQIQQFNQYLGIKYYLIVFEKN